jgi:hypothetical protein
MNRVLVVGLARNVERTLEKEVLRINKILSEIYGEVDFFIVESDSQDQTVKVLNSIAGSQRNFTFQTLGDLNLSFPHRIDRLRFCRNRYLNEVRKRFLTDSVFYSEIIVVDFDIKNNRLTKLKILKALHSSANWDALFANQTGRYFDILALRKEGWCDSDCMVEVWNLTKKGVSREKAKEQEIWSKMRIISATHDPIPVDSAFGGLGIYKPWVFLQFDYSTDDLDSNLSESEHVAFHRKIRNAGGSLYIHPALTNFSWNPHSLASFKVLRRLDKWSNSLVGSRLRSRLRALLG